MNVDNPAELEHMASEWQRIEAELSQLERRLRNSLRTGLMRSTDPGGRVASSMNTAAGQLTTARTSLAENAQRVRKAAQELRNVRA